MPTEQKYDVHIKVGFWFIAICVAIGFVIGAVIPVLADRAGVLHLGKTTQGVMHIGLRDALMYGVVCALFGAANGVFLSIKQKLWVAGLVLTVLPCGVFGGCAAALTPPPYLHEPNAFVFWSIPFLITGSCVFLRRQVWARYQKPVVGHSNRSR